MYKWEPEEKIHLTLKFLGEVKEELVESIINSLKFVSDYNRFECKLSRFGFFYKQGQSRVLWIGLTPNDYINQMVEKINKELEIFSIPSERRKFQPHLTVKRLKGDEGKNFIDSFEGFKVPDIQFKAYEAALMRSDLLSNGSKYTEIKRYNLK